MSRLVLSTVDVGGGRDVVGRDSEECGEEEVECGGLVSVDYSVYAEDDEHHCGYPVRPHSKLGV